MGRDHPLEFDDEDDIYYAELKRQVMVLTSEDNDEVLETKAEGGCNRLNSSFVEKLEPGSYFNWWERGNYDTVPAWLVKLWERGNYDTVQAWLVKLSSSNGTGVFIPQIVKSRKRCVHGRTNYRRRQVYRQVKQD